MMGLRSGWHGLLMATGLLLSAGCGISHNPSYFPYILPFGNIERTHAKPVGCGYYGNFDPHACRLEVRPKEATNPVGTQHVLIATIYDANCQPRRARRIEWMLEGVGHIVEVDESGYLPARGYKVDNRYAVSYTDYKEHTITRGNDDPNDDFTVRPGQSWCVITSPLEGDTYVTVYAPEIFNWDKHKVHVVKHWINAGWQLPVPAVNNIGTQHIFTTKVFRVSDQAPIANYRVRYTILDGPPAAFLPGQQPVAETVSDLQGNASVTLVQLKPQAGINRIGVEVIRPPDSPTGVGITIGRGETTKEWIAPNIQVNKAGPAVVSVGQTFNYVITVSNTGKIQTEGITVRDQVPEGLTFVSSQPPANPEGRDIVWTLGALPPGRSASIQATFRAERTGTITNCAIATTPEGLRSEHCTSTQVAAPGLAVNKTGPATVMVGQPINYQITITNTGNGPATNVNLQDDFEAGLEYEKYPSPIQLPIGTLSPGESKVVNLTLTARQAGRFVNRATATADGGLSAQSEHPVTVSQPRLGISKRGRTFVYAKRPAEWNITVQNQGEVPLTNVIVRDQLPPELSFQSAGQGGQVSGNQVVWNLGTLQPREERTVQVTTRAEQISPRVVNTAIASADQGLQERADATMEVRGIPALLMEAMDTQDPVEVGQQTTYEIKVTNTGSLPANGISLKAFVPQQLRVIRGSGPNQPQIEGNVVTYPEVDGLAPGRELNYQILVEAVEAGDVRFRAELRSKSLSAETVTEEEATNIYRPTNEPPQ